MGSGGVRASCQSTLCILAGIALGFGLLCLLGGGIVYGVSRTFTKISETHLVNRTTASNFTKDVDSKLDDIRSGSAENGVMLMEKANQLFYAAGAFGIATVTFLILSCVVAYKSRPTLAPPITSDPFAPAPDRNPPPLPGGETDGGATSPAPPAGSPPPPGAPSPPESPPAATSPVSDRVGSPTA